MAELTVYSVTVSELFYLLRVVKICFSELA